MTIDEVRQLWNQYGEADDPHSCPDEEFVRCEVCERSIAAQQKLQNNWYDLVNLLLKLDGESKQPRGWR